MYNVKQQKEVVISSFSHKSQVLKEKESKIIIVLSPKVNINLCAPVFGSVLIHFLIYIHNLSNALYAKIIP